MDNCTKRILTKRALLNILEHADMDAPIEVIVFLEHIVKNGKVANVTKLKLSDGAGIGGKDKGIVLSTVSG